MLILYYWPGASSVIPPIVLEEIGAPYERQLVNLAKGEHKADAYLKINPRGKVPALTVDGNVLTENVAILTYLAKQFPEARLLPQGTIEESRCISTMAWFASTVHPTCALDPHNRRWQDDHRLKMSAESRRHAVDVLGCADLQHLQLDAELRRSVADCIQGYWTRGRIPEYNDAR
jgi:glutathione S-transferase